MIENIINKYLLSESVSNDIYSQLGGNKFIAMTGAKNLILSNNSLSMRLPKAKNGINYVKIILNSSDTYDLEFGRVNGLDYKVKKIIKDVYVNKLIDVFEEETGLYTSL
mgnify:CR=1 FL=1